MTSCITPGNEQNAATKMRYGPGGQLVALIAKNPATGDQVTRYEYGVTLAENGVASNDLLRAEVYPGSADSTDRVVDLLWKGYGPRGNSSSSSSGGPGDELVHLQYGYDRASNRTHRADLVAQSYDKDFDELYEYDGMQRLKKFHRGRLTNDNQTIVNPTLQQGWQLDATGNWQNFTQNDQSDPAQTLDQQRVANRVNEITQIVRTVGAQWITQMLEACVACVAADGSIRILNCIEYGYSRKIDPKSPPAKPRYCQQLRKALDAAKVLPPCFKKCSRTIAQNLKPVARWSTDSMSTLRTCAFVFMAAMMSIAVPACSQKEGNMAVQEENTPSSVKEERISPAVLESRLHSETLPSDPYLPQIRVATAKHVATYLDYPTTHDMLSDEKFPSRFLSLPWDEPILSVRDDGLVEPLLLSACLQELRHVDVFNLLDPKCQVSGDLGQGLFVQCRPQRSGYRDTESDHRGKIRYWVFVVIGNLKAELPAAEKATKIRIGIDYEPILHSKRREAMDEAFAKARSERALRPDSSEFDYQFERRVLRENWFVDRDCYFRVDSRD